MNLAKNGAEIKVLNLTKKFGNHRVLHETNLEILPGEFVAIVGRSGCGKSTLLRLIAGLDRPSEGVVKIDGESVKQLNRSARVMFQDSRLLMWKRVLENVSLGLPKRWQERARWALQQVGLDERANDYPAVLSGGQRQRVALARALVSEPRLLLLDEPLGALDALTRIEMQRLIEQIWQEQQFTAMLVTHDIEEAVMLGDRVVLIEAGKITMNLPITFSRPRQRGDAAFAATVEHILERVLNTGTTRREYADTQENLALAESRLLN